MEGGFLEAFAHWLQAEEEELLYAPDAPVVDIGDIHPDDLTVHPQTHCLMCNRPSEIVLCAMCGDAAYRSMP